MIEPAQQIPRAKACGGKEERCEEPSYSFSPELDLICLERETGGSPASLPHQPDEIAPCAGYASGTLKMKPRSAIRSTCLFPIDAVGDTKAIAANLRAKYERVV